MAYDTKSGTRIAATKAIDDIMKTLYPDVKTATSGETDGRANADKNFAAKRKTLQNRLTKGRNWYRLQQRFSVGILALIPTGPIDGGDRGVSNERYVKLYLMFGGLADFEQGSRICLRRLSKPS